MNRGARLVAGFAIVAGLMSAIGSISVPVLAAHDADNPGG